jgi:hypothetical protein
MVIYCAFSHTEEAVCFQVPEVTFFGAGNHNTMYEARATWGNLTFRLQVIYIMTISIFLHPIVVLL